MKRVHLVNLTNIGGAEKILLNFLKFKESGTDIIINIGKKTDPEIVKSFPGLKVLSSASLFDEGKIRAPKFMRENLLLRKINKISPDRLIIWDYVANFPKRPKAKKIIFYDHGCSWCFPDNKKTHLFFEKVDGCIAVSYASKRIMELRFNLSCPIKVIKNDLEGKVVYPEKTFRDFSEKKIILGTASRLVSLKAIGVSMLTLKQLIERGINAELYIAGKGPEESGLRLLADRLGISSKVKFLGFIDDLSKFYKNIDLYISTSVAESFGLSCLDAILHHVPVIYPITNGQPEVIENGVTGVGIIPTVTQREYEEKTGIDINFPHKIYDPTYDRLTTAKVIDEKKCAEEITKLIEDNRINSLVKNTIDFCTEHSKSGKFNEYILSLEGGFNHWK
ncbi:glycosyltransferase [Tatumella sp. UCD-D_suzukii]|uniref:glycosyltransferase n=1 Tax=Tatumella sp. UCD-D_suzukii TaxID=1408192 RepID=UPI000472B2AC|nr:glycosyltransferase [Tatumella sp. UCD-D_suzukii]